MISPTATTLGTARSWIRFSCARFNLRYESAEEATASKTMSKALVSHHVIIFHSQIDSVV